MSLRVIDPGALTLVQDLGRPGWAAVGVTESGAADRHSLRLANLLAGNPPGTAALETVLGGLRVRAEDDLTVALAGAPAPVTVAAGTDSRHEPGPVVQLKEGDELVLGIPEWGMRTYLALPGGITAETVMGSASTDTLAGLGPAPLQPGAVIQVAGGGGGAGPAAGIATLEPGQEGWHGQPYMLDVLPGPRADWFTPRAVTTLLRTAFEVTGNSDRVGVRLDGPALRRSRDEELPSEAVLRGAIQVPADGKPLIFGPDHPVTGGYPVIGILTETAADASGQLRPGQQVRFRPHGDWSGQ